MFTVVMVPHKRAFVTLGHNSLPSACSDVGHKGIAQSAPGGGRAMPGTYGYVRTSRPGSPSCRAATRKHNASSCWLPAWRFLTSIRTPASPGFRYQQPAGLAFSGLPAGPG